MDQSERRPREAISKAELDRRIQVAAWDEFDRQPHPVTQFMYGGFTTRAWREAGRPRDPGHAELEARLRQMERDREERLYRPKQSRWWHAFWPFR